MKHRFFVNTDTVDIDNKQIGIHAHDTVAREFCAGVNHKGTKESVHEATRIARLFTAAPELLEAVKQSVSQLEKAYEPTYLDGHAALIRKFRAIINKAEGK